MNIYEENIEFYNMAGELVNISAYKGKVIVIVNTASKCGFTPQFERLEHLYQKYKNQDVCVLGFPCNQFREQDPGTNEEIQKFCQMNYGVTFNMFQKIDVNGENRHPLYCYLIDNSPQKTGVDIKWNFEKFIIDQKGNITNRFSSIKKPKSMEKHINKLL
ncbi:MAG: glutathione peroxidase [Clostridiales bacterium]|nr:glutathione peroxidase [Clostridiales bacterium]